MNRSLKYSLYICMILITVFILLLSLSPIIDRDALRMHLWLPKFWAEHDFLSFRKYNAGLDLSMLNLNYLYMLILKYIGIDQLCKVLHASFLIASGVLIFRFVKIRYDYAFAVFAYVFTITIPILLRLSSEVYVDLGLFFFAMLTIINFLKWLETDLNYNKYFWLSLLGSGLAFGTKYNAMIFSFIMTLLVSFAISRKTNKSQPALKAGITYGCLSILAALPWLIRNYYNSGNPFYPLFGSIFPSFLKFEVPLYPSGNEYVWRFTEGENILDIILLPIKFFFNGQDNNFLRYDGVANPFLLLLIPFAFLGKSKGMLAKNSKIYLLVIAGFITIYTAYFGNSTLRYAIAAFPCLIILTIEALSKIKNSQLKYSKQIAISIAIIAIGYNLNYGVSYFKNLDFTAYLAGKETKASYITRKTSFYAIHEYINKKTKSSAVVYDVFCGLRGYYVNRTYIGDEGILDRYFLNRIYLNEGINSFYKYLDSIPQADGIRATHLIIKPYAIIDTYKKIFYDNADTLEIINNQKLQPFVKFLNQQKPLMQDNGAILYEIDWSKYSKKFVKQ